MSDRFTPDSIDGDIEELLSPNANGDDARLTHALATLYAPPVEAGAALERVHARVLNGFVSVAGPASVELGTQLTSPHSHRHQRLKGQLSALGAVAAVALVALLAVSLFSRGPLLRVGSSPTSTVLVPTPTVSLPTPIPVSTPTISYLSAPGPNEGSQAVGPDGSFAYIVQNYGSPNHPELVYISPAGKVKTFTVPTVPGAANGARITMDSNGNVVGSTSAYISATKSVNITWLLDPRSGAVKDLPGSWCPAQGCTLGPDGFFWTYSFTGNLGDPTGHFLGVISRIDPDTNRTVSQTPVPAWIRSHVTTNAWGTTLLFFGAGSGGLTWFSVLYASHIWLASFNVNSGVFHTIELPRSFATVPEGSPAEMLASMEITASMEEEPVVAPDGSLWDVVQSPVCSGCAYQQSTIYRYTPDGHLTSFPNPLGDGHVPGGQPMYVPFPMLGVYLGYYVSDQNSNLCTFVLTGLAPNSTGAVWTYHCLSPQGAILTFGQMAADSIDVVGTGQVAYTAYHSIWVSGVGVALVEFPLSVRTPAGDVP